jgi:hypothetical protein
VFVLAAVVILRRAIAELVRAVVARMSDLKEFSGAGFRAEWFEDKAEEIREDVESLGGADTAPASDGHRPIDLGVDERLTNALVLAKLFPRAAVIEAFVWVESAGAKYLASTGSSRPTRSVAMQLRESAEVPPRIKKAVGDLSQLRNAAAHAEELDLTVEGAVNFVVSANEVATALKLLTE